MMESSNNKHKFKLTNESKQLLTELLLYLKTIKFDFKAFKSIVDFFDPDTDLAMFDTMINKMKIDHDKGNHDIKAKSIHKLKKAIDNINIDEYQGAIENNTSYDYIVDSTAKLFVIDSDAAARIMNYGFLPLDVLISLQQMRIFNLYNYTSSSGHQIQIYGPDISQSNINDIINLTTLSIQVMTRFANIMSLSFKVPKINIFMTNAKKQFTDNEFSITHINSAEYHPHGNNLNIFRQEELFKLLLHELGHCIKVEGRFRDVYDPKSSGSLAFNKKWAVKASDERYAPSNLSETIVEVFAEILNIYVCGKIYNNLDSFKEFVYIELLFGMFQTAHILKISGFNSMGEFINPKNVFISQSTSAVQYHIFKSILMLNFGKFVDVYDNNDMLGIYDMIYDFVVKDQIYNDLIGLMIDGYDKLDHNSILCKTGRMSLLELSF